jgi:hypothetical protein
MSHDEASKVMLQAGLRPLETYPGNQKLWRCECTVCGNEIQVRRNGVADNGNGCKFCWENRRGQALRIPEEEAIAVMRAAGLEPLDPYVVSGQPWRCLHLECGREVFPSYNTIQQGRGGCQQCGYLKTAAAMRHDAEFAIEIMRSAGLEPLENYPGSKSKWRCLHHECGQEVFATLGGVRQGESGCFKCGAKKRGIASRTDPEEARQFMIAIGLEPQEPYELSNKPWKCIHKECGSTVFQLLAASKAVNEAVDHAPSKRMRFEAVTHPSTQSIKPSLVATNRLRITRALKLIGAVSTYLVDAK